MIAVVSSRIVAGARSIVMLGASATQVLRGGRNGIGELVFALLLAAIAWIRWRDRWRIARTVTVTPL